MRSSCTPTSNGAPIDQDAFLPIYEIIARSGRPILLHPIRTREMADYRTETTSKYEINSVIGWPFETGAALARLVFSGIMDRFPGPQGHHPSSRRHHPLFRRAGRAQLGPARRAHVGRGLCVPPQAPEEAPARLLQGILRRHRARRRPRAHDLRNFLLHAPTGWCSHRTVRSIPKRARATSVRRSRSSRASTYTQGRSREDLPPQCRSSVRPEVFVDRSDRRRVERSDTHRRPVAGRDGFRHDVAGNPSYDTGERGRSCGSCGTFCAAR